MKMTATPIPRTLYFNISGDMDISLIRGRPLDRRPVQTEVVPHGDRPRIDGALTDHLAGGGQGLVACPVIEEAGEQELKTPFQVHDRPAGRFAPAHTGCLIHGRLSGDEKVSVLERFRKEGIDILVGPP